MILEHLSSKEGVDFVRSAKPQVGGTITPYHLDPDPHRLAGLRASSPTCT